MTDKTQLKRNIGQLLLPILTLTFLILHTMLVLQQKEVLGDIGIRPVLLVLFTVFNCLFVAAGCFWSRISGGRMQVLVCAIAILAGVGACYQVMFNGYTKYIILLTGSMCCGIVTYLLSRNKTTVSDAVYYAVTGLIVVLLAANLLFGKEKNGAKLWIYIGSFSFQPGEMVKLLLMILAACSFNDMKRSILYYAAAMVSCALLLYLRDMGNAAIILALFILNTYLLFDNRVFSLSIIGLSVAAFIVALCVLPYARLRFQDWFQAMNNPGSQQHQYILSILYAGFGGKGLEGLERIRTVFGRTDDGVLACYTSIYGVPMTMVVFGAYSLLVSQVNRNKSPYPSGYFVLAQVSMYLFCQVILHFCGSLDLLPFTGVTCPLLSTGGTSMLCTTIMFGLQAAALHPAEPIVKED